MSHSGRQLLIAEKRCHWACMSTYANVVEIEASRARAMALCSVSVASEIEEMLKKAIARFGKTYVRVNNVPAGWVVKRLVEQTAEEWDRLVDTNLQGVFLCCRYLLPEMLVFSTPPCGIGQMRNGEMKCGDRRNVDDRAALALDHFRCSSRIDPKAPYPLPAD